MYNKNFKNQAVKEVKNGSSVNSAAKKYGIAVSTLLNWVNDYDEKMFEMTREKSVEPTPVVKIAPAGIKLKSIKVLIGGSAVTLRRNDALRILNIFNIFDERMEGE